MPIITSAANTKNNNMIGTVCSIFILVPPSQQAKPNAELTGAGCLFRPLRTLKCHAYYFR